MHPGDPERVDTGGASPPKGSPLGNWGLRGSWPRRVGRPYTGAIEGQLPLDLLPHAD